MAELKPRHTTRFLASAHLYTPPAEEQMVAMASLDKLRALLPPGVDPETKPALLFVAANLAVGAVANLNDDALTLDDTLRTYRGFEWQLVDVEHDRSQLRGFIVKAGLSELGTDRLITEAEARTAGKPVNIAVVLALWKVVDPDLCAFIERMDAPASPDKGKLSLSFEVGFDDYDIAVLPNGASNLALASQMVTPDAADFGRYDRLLRVNGGKGALGKDSRVVRVLVGNIVPLGAGIVTVPAAAVKGLTTITSSPHAADASAAQSVAAEVYSPEDMASKTVQIAAEFTGLTESITRSVQEGLAAVSLSRQIKLSEGWQTQLAALQAQAGKGGNAPLVNGVNITLSDGRTISNVKVFDGSTLELDKELSMSGVVITSMTPGVPPQADSPEIEHPHKALTFPTTSAEQQARDAANEAQRHAGQNAAYTDASVSGADISARIKEVVVGTLVEQQRVGGALHSVDSRFAVAAADIAAAFARVGLDAKTTTAGVSPSTPSSPMDLTTLKQSLAAVKSVEDLPTAVANVSLFADAIAAASEKLAAERKTAQEAAAAAQASVEQIKADLAALTKTHNEIVATQQAKAAEDAFNQHMAAVEATFDLDTEVRAEIIDEVKAAASDEAFAKWMTSAKKKMKGFIKKTKSDNDGDEADASKTAAAAKLALASATNNPVDADLAHDFAATATLSQQMQATFAAGVSINGVKVADLAKKK